MKTLTKTLLIVGSYLCLMLLPIEGNAQCVQCAPAPPDGFVCVPSTSGGGGCRTDPGSCTLISPCVPNGDRTGTPCGVKGLSNPQVSISDSIIREIGAVDPRLALVVLNVSRIKAEFTVARVNFTPVVYTFDDVEIQLTRPSDPAYLKQLQQRISDSFANGGSVVSYEVLISPNTGTDSFNLSVSRTGETGESVDVNLQRASFGKGKNQSQGFKAVSYQIK